jgi:hypothetical protein
MIHNCRYYIIIKLKDIKYYLSHLSMSRSLFNKHINSKLVSKYVKYSTKHNIINNFSIYSCSKHISDIIKDILE